MISSSSMLDCCSPSTLSSGTKTLPFPRSFLSGDFSQIFFIYLWFPLPTFQIVLSPALLSLCWILLTHVTSSYFIWLYSQSGSCFPRPFLTRFLGSFFGVLAREPISLILTRWLYRRGCLGFSCVLRYWTGIHASGVSSLSFFFLMSAIFFQLKYFHVQVGLGCGRAEIHNSGTSSPVLELRVLLMLYYPLVRSLTHSETFGRSVSSSVPLWFFRAGVGLHGGAESKSGASLRCYFRPGEEASQFPSVSSEGWNFQKSF